LIGCVSNEQIFLDMTLRKIFFWDGLPLQWIAKLVNNCVEIRQL